jgi:hypothetical protein
MIKTLLSNGPAVGFLMSATSLATVSARRKPLPFDGRDDAVTSGKMPTWLPWAVLAILAVSSTVFGVLHPDVFAVAMNEGITSP